MPALNLTPQITHVALDGGIAPNTEQVIEAVLVDYLGVSLEQRSGCDGGAVEYGEVLETLRSKQADASVAKEIVHQECELAQSAAALVPLEVEVLEAGEAAGLHVAPAVHKTDIELAFLVARVVHVFALRLHGMRAVAAE